MSAVNGARSGWTTYNAKDLVARPVWDSYQARRNRYAIFQAYYDNTIYDAVESFSGTLKTNQRLYKHIRGLYNPVKRENGLYVSNVYQGTVDTKTLTGGAMPLVFDNKAFEPALQNILRWSNLSQQLSTYVRHAALLGDAFWWVVDDPMRRRVRLESLHPSKVRDIERDEVGNIRAAVIEYDYLEDPAVDQYKPSRYDSGSRNEQKWHTKTIIVDKNEFSTFRDGEPFAFYQDADGAPMTRWDNPYGFVPLTLAHFEPTDDGWGKNSFYASRRKIDELNDQMSIIDDVIRRVIEPLLKAKGVSKAEEITTQRDDKSSITILYLSNPEGDIEAIQIPVDIAAASAKAESQLAEIERDMPLLALQRVREGGNLTAPGIKAGYSDAIGLVVNTRQNVDPSVVAALQMATTMGAMSGYDGFQGFNEQSFDRGDMQLAIAERPVISESLSKTDKLNSLGTVKDQPPEVARLMMREMGYSETDIDAVVGSLEAGQQANNTAEITDGDETSAVRRNEDILAQLGITDLLPVTNGNGNGSE